MIIISRVYQRKLAKQVSSQYWQKNGRFQAFEIGIMNMPFWRSCKPTILPDLQGFIAMAWCSANSALKSF